MIKDVIKKLSQITGKNKVALLLITIVILFSVLIVPTVAKYFNTIYLNFNYELSGVAFDGKNLVDSDVNLTASRERLINPYRGFYYHTTIHLPAYDKKSNETNERNRQSLLENTSSNIVHMTEEKQSLALFQVYLENYVEVEQLPSYYISVLNECMDIYRKSGFKTIVRFAYGSEYNESNSENEVRNEPKDFNTILNHVTQLSTFFEKNKDVIATVQLGFIGPWGEMHSSEFATTKYINRLIDTSLKAIPYPIQISLRRPKYYRGYFNDDQSFFDARLAYTNNPRSRLALFNDAFISSETDKGTYAKGEREKELEWQDYLTKYVYFGGEMSYSSTTYPTTNDHYYNVPDAIYNMEKTHIQYLHDGYARAILNKWKETPITNDIDSKYNGLDAYTYFANRLGYRYLITDAKVPGYNVPQGGILNFKTTILNEGFGNLLYQRKVYVLLEKDGKYYKAESNIDPLKWYSKKEVTNELSFKLPSNIKTGTWNIYYSLPDPYEGYEDNNNATIKFANEGIYNTYLLANYIGKVNIVKGTGDGNNGFFQINDYDGTIYDNSTLYQMKRPLILDGKISSEYDWFENEIRYADNKTTIYLREDDNNIYIYATDKSITASNYKIQMSILTKDSKSATDYLYMTEDNRIYDGSWFNNGVVANSKTDVEFGISSGIEYAISKKRINVKSASDLVGLRINYVDSNWDTVYLIDISDFNKKPLSIDADGILSEYEWTESHKIHEDKNTILYLKTDEDYLYIYGEIKNYKAIDYPNIQLDIATTQKSPSCTEYAFMTENKNIYDGSYSSNNLVDDSETPTTGYGKNNGFEYIIPLKRIGINKVDDIIGLGIKYITSDWRVALKYSLAIGKSVFEIDGINNDASWKKDHLIISNSKIAIYTEQIDNNIYLYSETEIPFEHLKISFSTTAGANPKEYNYILRDDELSDGNDNVLSTIEMGMLSNSFEYLIPMSSININSLSDLISFEILLRDESRDDLYKLVIPNINGKLIIDGTISSTEEWNSTHLISSKNNIELYSKEIGNETFYYINYLGDITNISNYSITYYSGSTRIAKIENSNIYLRDNDNSSWINAGKAWNSINTGIEVGACLSDVGITDPSIISLYKVTLMDSEWNGIAEEIIDITTE